MSSRLLIAVVALAIAMAAAASAGFSPTRQLDVTVGPTWVFDGGFPGHVRIDDAGRAIATGRFAGLPAAGAVLDRVSGKLRVAVNAHGDINAVVPDGRGGWYIGGRFERVRGVRRDSLVHLDEVGRIDRTWRAGVNGYVNALALHQGVLYVAGRFPTANGRERRHLAAFDALTGRTTDWHPTPHGEVFALAVAEDRLLVGGRFDRIGKAPRSLLAAFRLDDGALLPWRADAYYMQRRSEGVRAIAVAAGTAYIGGHFTRIGGEPRRRLAAIDTRSGKTLAWRADADGIVYALAANESIVVAGGRFERIGDDSRIGIAALDARSGRPAPLSLNLSPSPQGYEPRARVYSLALGDGTLYIGGDFSALNRRPRNYTAAVRIASGLVTAWNPRPNAAVQALGLHGSRILAGGAFTGVEGDTLNGLVEIGVDGSPTAWRPQARVHGPIAISGRTVYASVGGRGVVAVDRQSGAIRQLNLGIRNAHVLLAHRGSLIAAELSSSPVSLELRSGKRRTFGSGLSLIHAIVADRERIYVAAGDTVVAFDRRTLRATWQAKADDWILDIRLRGRTLVVAGDFSMIKGNPRHNLATLDRLSGRVTDWRARLTGQDFAVRAIAVRGDIIFVGGFDFAKSGGLTAVNAVTGAVVEGLPYVDGQVFDVRTRASDVWLAGDLDRIGSQTVGGVAHIRIR